MKTNSNNDPCDDDDYFCDYDEDEDDEVFKPASQPILKPNGSAIKRLISTSFQFSRLVNKCSYFT
jgi:hypothetical protein